MKERIRDYQSSDCTNVVALSLRAWAPVFGSMEQVLGQEIFVRLHGDSLALDSLALAGAGPG